MKNKTVIVVGSGIAGLNTAFSLVEKGYRVKVIERSSYIGGKLRQLDFQFPNDACGMCQIYPLYDSSFLDMCIRRGVSHEDIEFYTRAEVISVEGKEGNLKVKIRKHPRGVNENCTSCGKCVEVCPENRFSEFNYITQKAIYRDYVRNFPDIYAIDFNACTRCGKCVEICPENAINLEEKEKEETIDAAYLFVASGIKERDIRYLKEFGVGIYPNVIISTHFERLLSGNRPSQGELKRPSDGKMPKKIAFIQCMGSRDRQNPRCSSICCMFTLKEVRILKEYFPEVEPWVFYMDMRTFTKGGYRYFKETDAVFKNARPAKIEEDEKHNLILYFEEGGKFRREVFDLVVLSIGTEVEIPSYVNKNGIYLLYDEPLEIREALIRSYEATLNVPVLEKEKEAFNFPLKDEYVLGIVDTTGEYKKEGDHIIRHSPLRNKKDVDALLEKLKKEGIDLFVLIARSRYTTEGLLSYKVSPLAFEIVDSERENDLDFAVRRSILKLRYRTPSLKDTQKVEKSVLVVGGGVAGMSAAVELAKKGVRVHLVEKRSELGGEALHVKRRIDGTHEDTPKMLINKVKELGIPVYLKSEFLRIRGIPGEYVADIRKGNDVVNIGVSAVVLTTGAKAYIPSEYNYKNSDKIITQREFEEKFDNVKSLKSVAMLQCVGSRNADFPVCSVVCCKDALKNAIYIKEKNPACEVYVLYRDMMAYGKNEEYYTEARKKGVIFIRYTEDMPPSLRIESDGVILDVHDKTFEMDLEIKPDLVILSTGFRPNKENKEMAEKLGIDIDEDGFFNTLNVKFNPIQAKNPGVFVAGTALAPMSIDDAVTSGRAAASKVLDFLNNFGVHKRYRTSDVKERTCAGCGLCVDVCPFEARYIDEDEKVAKVIYDICQGCGLCVASCPSGSAYLVGEETKGIINVLSEI